MFGALDTKLFQLLLIIRPIVVAAVTSRSIGTHMLEMLMVDCCPSELGSRRVAERDYFAF